MTEEHATTDVEVAAADSSADVRAIFVIFIAAVVMAVHFVSGFTFDF